MFSSFDSQVLDLLREFVLGLPSTLSKRLLHINVFLETVIHPLDRLLDVLLSVDLELFLDLLQLL